MATPEYDMGHVVRVAIEGTMNINGHVQEYVNIHHWYRLSDDADFSNLDEVEAIYNDFLLPPYMDMYYNTVTNINMLRIQTVVGPFPEVLLSAQALNGTRTLDGDLLPPYSAIVLSGRCHNIGRRFRGRNYFSGFAEQDQNGGVWESDMLNLVSDFIGALIPYTAHPGFTGDWTIGVLSDPYHTLPYDVPLDIGPTSPFFTPYSGFDQRATVFTQKKRKFRNLLDIS